MGWQDAATWVIVAVAAAYFGRRTWASFRPATRSAGCVKGCGTCPSAAKASPPVQIVSIGGTAIPPSRPHAH